MDYIDHDLGGAKSFDPLLHKIVNSKNKQLEEVIASNEKENAAKRVEHDQRSKTANLFEEDLEHMNRVQTKATKVQLNTL